MGRRGSFGGLIWVVIGIFVAIHYNYNSVSDFAHILSFLLAIMFWPLLFLGVSLHVSLGF
jgi:hypothetical protein